MNPNYAVDIAYGGTNFSPYVNGPLAVLLMAVVIFFIVLAIVWIVLPFGIFGTKKRLDLIRNELIEIKKAMRPHERTTTHQSHN